MQKINSIYFNSSIYITRHYTKYHQTYKKKLKTFPISKGIKKQKMRYKWISHYHNYNHRISNTVFSSYLGFCLQICLFVCLFVNRNYFGVSQPVVFRTHQMRKVSPFWALFTGTHITHNHIYTYSHTQKNYTHISHAYMFGHIHTNCILVNFFINQSTFFIFKFLTL